MCAFDGGLAGEFLKRWREELNFSQYEITSMLGYKNVNFISMIERGMAKIPADRITDFAKVYMIPEHLMSALILKCNYPEIWDIVEGINESCKIADKDLTNKAFNEWWQKQSTRFGLTNSEWMLLQREREALKNSRIEAKKKKGNLDN